MGTGEPAATKEQDFDRLSELKAFDEMKAGVKGLVDAGITKVPRIFYSQTDGFDRAPADDFAIPLIDIDAVEKNPSLRTSVVDRVRDASGKWGFFQVVNHGIPGSVLEEMLEGVRRFYEQDAEVKKQWYTRDGLKTVVYNSNYNLYAAESVDWRDTTYICMAPTPPDPEDLPLECRDIIVEYSKQVTKLGRYLFELLSEALNLNPNHLKNIGCADGLGVLYHYYPPCPEPELTLGASAHTDIDFLTVLLQDHIGGLQVLYNNQWFDIPPVPGALVVNIGDLLQLVSNDNFKSGLHRVLASPAGPRLSVACFFTTGLIPSPKVYGPIKELLSDDNPPKYRETTVREYSLHYNTKKDHEASALLDFLV
ncbi:1-aminocyclopropane-1-carboxylate oxidase homolog 1 [Sesamum indicum]|uniref:1-aminocyclopropane-1-carboxylate oxidase homolog 1 n=1 Tax=Sesamum indicum TaxID=4182 RepID=A0A6I9U1B1_SESIN|nr:1-aminocyclopropane-1-carboxylate oxidase homolog 1 [Sesamum indicum]